MPPIPPDAALQAAHRKSYDVHPGERLVRLPEVLSITGESKTTAYENMAHPDPELRHPLPLKDGRAALFLLSEIHAYLAKKIARLPRKG